MSDDFSDCLIKAGMVVFILVVIGLLGILAYLTHGIIFLIFLSPVVLVYSLAWLCYSWKKYKRKKNNV